MQLGTYSLSLTVKDIATSKEFCEKLGFKEFGGNISQNLRLRFNDFFDTEKSAMEDGC